MTSYLRVLTICALATTSLAADHPVEGDRLRLRDPSTPAHRTVRFRAVREPAIDHTMAADPRVVGATLEVTGRGSSDGSSGIETYDTARFLYADLQADGTAVLDFNEAYNPPCAFNQFTTCPIPLRENRLEVKILAGEKAYARPAPSGRAGLPDPASHRR